MQNQSYEGGVIDDSDEDFDFLTLDGDEALSSSDSNLRLSQSPNLAEIPEAIIVDKIPEAIPVSAVPIARRGKSQPMAAIPGIPTTVRRRSTTLPSQRRVTDDVELGDLIEKPATSPAAKQIRPEKFRSLEAYRDGDLPVQPLSRAETARIRKDNTERGKFFDGDLPRTVERGVKYSNPVMLTITAIAVLLLRILIPLNILTLPAVAFFAPEQFYSFWYLPTALLLVGIVWLINIGKARCRVCTCHFFLKRNCLMHVKAHRIPLIGLPASAALHLLLFRWMRCMYCGTAIRTGSARKED